MFNVKQMVQVGKIFFKQNKPTIELVAGAGLIVAGTAFLIKDAQKIADANAEVAETINYVKEIDQAVKDDHSSWKEEEKDNRSKSSYLIHAGVHHSLAYIKVCGKGVACTVAGLALVTMAHVDLTKQIQAISAAAAAEAISFANYRKRVREELGPEKDYQYFTGNMQKTVTINEDGTVVEETKPVSKIDQGMLPPNSFWLSQTGLYTGNNLRDWANIERALHTANDVLHYEKMLTTNQIYKCFLAPFTVAGQAGGAWAQNKDGSHNYLDINIDPCEANSFKNGLVDDVLITITYLNGVPLERNVLGDQRIHDLMGWKSC